MTMRIRICTRVSTSAHRGQKKMAEFLKLEFQEIVSHPIFGAGIQTLVLTQSSKCYLIAEPSKSKASVPSKV